MIQYTDVVMDEFTKRPIEGAEVFIYQTPEQDGDTPKLATLYAADGVTPVANPVITNNLGVYSFFNPAGELVGDVYVGARLRYRSRLFVGGGYSGAASTAAAAAAAAVGQPSYPNTASGLADTLIGQTFWVDNNDGTGTTYRHDPGPVATEIGKFVLDQTASGAADLLAGGVPTTAALASSTGGEMVGFEQIGVGAVLRDVNAKLEEASVSVDDFGAVGNGVANDSAAIVKAQDAVEAMGGGVVQYTHGKTYLVDTPIKLVSGITHRGTGRSFTDLIVTKPGAKIISGTGALFVDEDNETIAGVNFENLWLESASGGGHIFDLSGAGTAVVAKLNFSGCTLRQANIDKSIIHGYSATGVFSVDIDHCEMLYSGLNTVPPLDFKSETLNSITIGGNSWMTAAPAANGNGTYAISFEIDNPSGTANNIRISDVLFEVTVGGAIRMLSCASSSIVNCAVYDLTESGYSPNNPMIYIDQAANGQPSYGIEIDTFVSRVGTVSKPDILIDTSVGGQSSFILTNVTASYVDGTSASGGAAVLINGGSINNFQNIAYTRLTASPTLDIAFGSTAAGSAAFSIWNGFPSNNNGHLNISVNGVRRGSFSDGGLFQWAGTAADPSFYVDTSGEMRTKRPLYPPDGAGSFQSATAFIGGTGVPGSGVGANGMYYFRSDPSGALTHIYHKSGGAWTGIV